MRLTERLRGVSAEAKAIRQSMTIVDPRAKGFSPDAGGVTESDRLIRQNRGGDFMSRVTECAELLEAVYAGRRPVWHLREAMTTSDFPLLFGDLLYRQLLGYYMPYPVSYPSYFRIYDLNDFRNLNLYTIDGGQAVMKTTIKEREPYPEIVFKEGRYQLKVGKYGRRYGITWEMVINDDLNAFAQRPMMMATGARRSEEYLATTMIADAAGPHAAFFTAGNANIVTGNPALTIAGLQTAYQVLAAQKDADNEPIVVQASVLVVPPALMITAENILNAIQIRIAEAGGTANQLMYVNNWMKSKVTLAVNPYLPVVTTTGTVGSSEWFLFSDPNDMSTRPAMTFGFLRGRRTPQLFVKDPNQQELGGGDVSPLEGDFATDSIDYKLRHVFGAAQADPKMAVASKGQ